MARDSCTSFGVERLWPSLFQSSVDNCGLCDAPLGRLINHPGEQTNSAYLITELNAFKKVDVKVRVCQSTLMSRFAHSRKIVIFCVLQKIASLMIFRVSCEIASDDFLCYMTGRTEPRL